jgi:nucleoid DNA-binding protein
MATLAKKAIIDKIAETHQVRSVTVKKIVQAGISHITTHNLLSYAAEPYFQ